MLQFGATDLKIGQRMLQCASNTQCAQAHCEICGPLLPHLNFADHVLGVTLHYTAQYVLCKTRHGPAGHVHMGRHSGQSLA